MTAEFCGTSATRNTENNAGVSATLLAMVKKSCVGVFGILPDPIPRTTVDHIDELYDKFIGTEGQ